MMTLQNLRLMTASSKKHSVVYRPVMSPSSNIYPTRLDSDKHEIRLLTLLIGTPKSAISCSLKTAPLSLNPTYNALSYAWGDASITRDVLVDGHPYAVTQNLEAALRHLRSTTEPRVLWVDALCINQVDVDERSAQVQTMGEIFSSASRVFVWIGVADKDSDVVFDMITSIADDNVGDDGIMKSYIWFCNVTNRPWFSRLWVLQEFVLARQDPIVVCGWKTSHWSTLLTAFNVLRSGRVKTMMSIEDRINLDESSSVGKFTSLGILRRSIPLQGGSDLVDVIHLATELEATDPKDNIYALLGMLRPDDRAHLTVDYLKPTATIYAEATADIIADWKSNIYDLSIVSWARLSQRSSLIRGLPSWVPDYSLSSVKKNLMGLNLHSVPYGQRGASGSLTARNGRLLSDKITLKVEALPFGIVNDLVQFADTKIRCIEQLLEIGTSAAAAKSRAVSDFRFLPLFEFLRTKEPTWKILNTNNDWVVPSPKCDEEMYDHVRLGGFWAKDYPADNVQDDENQVGAFLELLGYALRGLIFFTTSNGFVGLGMPGIREGDRVTIWLGARMPFIVRNLDDQYCTLVGSSYIGGIMDGEIVEEAYYKGLIESETLYVR